MIPDVSAALIVIAGVLLIMTASLATSMSPKSRQTIGAVGLLIGGLGVLVYLISMLYVVTGPG